MRLKRYLRGLGIGIIVTALIIGISSFTQSNNMTDEEIKAKAIELGMVAGPDSLVEITPEIIESVVENSQEESKEESKEESLEEFSEEKSQEESSEEIQMEETINLEEEIQNIVVLTIKSGDSSNVVASELERLHVIDSGSELDEYLCAYEYAKKIRVGTYEIPINSTYEQIASILCEVE